MRIAMAGDDCSLHFALEELTPKQQADHESNQVLTGMLQVALLYIAKPQDTVCLYDTFTETPWREALHRYHAMFKRAGLNPTPLERVQYHPRDGFYEAVAATPADVELENLYMISNSNFVLHQQADDLVNSQNLNSKIHFAEHAPEFGLNVPATLATTKGQLQSDQVAEFVSRHGTPMMLKTLGLAGARNVTVINAIEDAQNYLAEYDDELEIILQQRLSFADYTEMTVDLFVSNDHIEVTNVRQIMFADGLWVGNLMGSAVTLPARHEQALLQVGEYARAHGYTTDIGYNLGIDYFVRNADAAADLPELVVTEINARWTGGLFPAELVRRLGCGDRQVVAFIDMCPPARFDDYMDFLEANLYSTNDSVWSIVPMGFAPYPTAIENAEYLFVWQVVVGDFDAFKTAKHQSLGDDVLVTVPNISIEL
jgi:hypothetical protein